ncbi:acetylornithine deacetylase [Marinicauda algicola]|uniref:Acetylornithine deacetylase n=1 Tax=Marinicauda algicola TaxID=2029849 RepID=A0A4S2H1J2_9PROT|nr:acetylornithine deacetylase [Marinicauda algicola]TGY89293.1 acetylornithine deacetylase [Marinicauda algicola]
MNDPRDILKTLVGFDTTSRNSNLDLIDWVEAYLADLGARTERIASGDGRKANLHAVLGPEEDGGIVLSGHTDVVPVDGQDWSCDPFELTAREGRLYGRGTCDMKGFIACALAAAPGFAKAKLKKPVHFAFSYDEEVGCLGAPAMIRAMMAGSPRPRLAIVGEPTNMQVVTGHKGLFSMHVELHGKEAHSSRVNDGACAVTHAVPLMNFLYEEAQKLKDAAPADSPFDPPYGTLTIGQMGGGTAVNILAKQAWFFWLMRPAPWDDAPDIARRLREKAVEIEARMRESAPEARVSVTQRSDVPPLKPEADGEAEHLARQLTGDNATRTVSYGTEAGQFQEAGLSVVVCGPGSIEQAHQGDEFIEESQIEACMSFLGKLEKRLAG